MAAQNDSEKLEVTSCRISSGTEPHQGQHLLHSGTHPNHGREFQASENEQHVPLNCARDDTTLLSVTYTQAGREAGHLAPTGFVVTI